MSKVSVDLSVASQYIESKGRLYGLKRRLTYRFAFKLIEKFCEVNNVNRALEVGTGAGFFSSISKNVTLKLSYMDRI